MILLVAAAVTVALIVRSRRDRRFHRRGAHLVLAAASYLVSDNLGNSIMALDFLPALVLGITWAGGVLARPRSSPGSPASGRQSSRE